MTVRGSCHCKAIEFQVHGTPKVVLDCNCTICTKKGFLHWIVDKSDLTILRGQECLTNYQFHTKTAHHTFCKICGMHPFYIPRSHPHAYDINVRCLDDVDLSTLHIQAFDGKNWETSVEKIR